MPRKSVMHRRPFFVVSAPRSGSTLLRLILDAHPRLAVPKLSAEALVDAAETPSFAGLYAALHRAYAQSERKQRWGEKTPRNSFWMEQFDVHMLAPHETRSAREWSTHPLHARSMN